MLPIGRPNFDEAGRTTKKKLNGLDVGYLLKTTNVLHHLPHEEFRYWDVSPTRFSHLRFSDIVKHNEVQCIYCHTWTFLASQKLQHSFMKFDIGKLNEKCGEIRISRHTETQQSPVYILSYVDFPCIPKTTAQFDEIRYRKTE